LNLSKSFLIVIALIVIYIIFLSFSDIEKTVSTITSIDVKYLLGGIVLWLISGSLRVLRWHFFLKSITNKIPFVRSSLYFLSGFAFILSPARAGEILRSPFIKRDYNISISKTAPIVLVERFYDLLGGTIIISIGLIFADFDKAIIILPIGFLAIILFIMRSKTIFNKLFLRLSKIRFISKLLPNVEESFEVISTLMKPKYFLVGTLLPIIFSMLEVAGVYLFILGLSETINFNDLLVIYQATNIAAGLSMIPGGVGILEGGMVGLFVLYKIKYEVALSVALLTRLVSTGMFSVIGIVCFYIISKKNKTS
jgi:glycosyltransferase 2 family protein